MTAHTDPEREQAIEWLRARLKPGDVVYTIVRHVSRSGMSCTVSLIGFRIDGSDPDHHSWNLRLIDYTYNAALALGAKWPYDSARNAIKAFSAANLIDNLAALLFGDETALSNRTL